MSGKNWSVVLHLNYITIYLWTDQVKKAILANCSPSCTTTSVANIAIEEAQKKRTPNTPQFLIIVPASSLEFHSQKCWSSAAFLLPIPCFDNHTITGRTFVSSCLPDWLTDRLTDRPSDTRLTASHHPSLLLHSFLCRIPQFGEYYPPR